MVYDWFNRTGPTGTDSEAAPVEASEPAPAPDAPASPAPAADQPSDGSADANPNPDPNAEALEWARQAYARLKAQQQAQKQAQQEPAPNLTAQPQAGSQAEPEVDPQPEFPPNPGPESVQPVQNSAEGVAAPTVAGLSLLEQAAAQRAERQQAITAAGPQSTDTPPAATDSPEPSLGDFDTTFTWSAEVLAAQGKRVDQVSLEEIDWLGRLRQGLEKTRQGFVTQLLDTLGDDPLTPEVVDDL